MSLVPLPSLVALLAIQAVSVGAAQDPPAQDLPAQDLPAQNLPAQGGAQLDPATFGPSWIETMGEAAARGQDAPRLRDPKVRGDAPGEWRIPSESDAVRPHSGRRYVYNSWGDTRLGIGFRREVTLTEVWIARHGGRGATTEGVRVVGFRGGVEVGRSAWFEAIGEQPVRWSIELPAVDRVEFEARAVVSGAGWYALDDLSFAADGPAGSESFVVDYEELEFGARLSGSEYFGLDWELGRGEFQASAHATAPLHGSATPPPSAAQATSSSPPTAMASMGVCGPTAEFGFAGPQYNDDGTLGVPDTNGAVGVHHYVAAPNGHIAVYDKLTGQSLISTSQPNFFGAPGVLGDPRVAYDSHHDRFVLMASDWTSRIYLAYSLTDDPTGAWFKTSFNAAQGVDVGKWPDYPTLGLDADGIYIGVLMFPDMTIFAIDKAPLLAATPSLGSITAWRLLPFEGAIQPCVTFGDSGGPYLVSRASSAGLRIRQVVGPMTSPALVEKGVVAVPAFSEAPDAPQAGTAIELTAGTTRPMNAVFRNGSLWTVHPVNVDGRAAVRWYEIDPVTASLIQTGVVADPVRSYFMPSIAVNGSGEMVVGCTGSSPFEFASAYATGRRPSDPVGTTAAPLLLRAGQAPYTFLDFQGVSRWGDYSVTGVDPADDDVLWTIQEYALPGDVWGTWVNSIRFDPGTLTDCDGNGLSDACEILSNPLLDLDLDGGLDACQLLSADTDGVSVAQGGTQTLQLHAGGAHAGKLYLLLGSVTGTEPGTPIDGQVLPLNLDGYMLFTLNSPNSTPLSNSLSVLDASGMGVAQFALPAATLSVSQVGTTLHHAYGVLGAQVEQTSNAIPVTLLP